MKGAVLIYEGRIKNIIKTLFNGIDIKDYFFNLSYWESYEYSNANYDFNAEENVSSDIFKNELFKEELEIYPEFLELFVSKKECDYNEPLLYKNFIDSDYFLSIIIIDRIDIEICCKEENILKQMIENFNGIPLEDKKVMILDNIRMDASLSAYRCNNEINIYDI